MFSRVAGAISGGEPQHASNDEGASLTSVLETPALRVELALLVLLCIDSMRSDLTASFDTDNLAPPKIDAKTAISPVAKANQPIPDLMSLDEPQNVTTSGAGYNSQAPQSDMESTQMQALRRSALTFIDKWRGSVMRRICDVLCVRPETVRQAKARRKQALDDAEKQKQGISSLIDFGDEDPFAEKKGSEKRKHGHYEVIETRILALSNEKRVLILHCLLLLLLSLESYTAHSRVLLLHLASSLELETDMLAEHETSVAQGLLATAASQMDAEETAKRQASNNAASRRWKVGLAAVGGAVLIGVTGGLAAPLLAAGLGTVMGGLGLGVVSTYLGALAGSSVLVGSLFGAYGAKMTGRLMEQYAKEVDDFEFVPVQDPTRPSAQRDNEWADEQDARDPVKREQHRLRVAIGISGWLSSPSDVNKPWEVIDAATTEPFALRFELEAMLRLGNSLEDVLFSYAWDGVTYTVMSRTLLGALYAGLWPLGLIKAASVLDNPFSVALARADKAGKVLAHALIDGVQGKRPVTLAGYSIGARVIYACLVELAEQHAFGLVESAILIGTPAPSDNKPWRQIRSVVAGRVANVYSTDDYVLGFLYRSTKLQRGVAGLQKIDNVNGVENMDASKLVNGHDQYRYMVGTILTKLGFGDVDFNKVAEQQRAMEVAERKKEQVKKQAMEAERTSAQRKSASRSTSMKEAKPPSQNPSRTPRDPLTSQNTSPTSLTPIVMFEQPEPQPSTNINSTSTSQLVPHPLDSSPPSTPKANPANLTSPPSKSPPQPLPHPLTSSSPPHPPSKATQTIALPSNPLPLKPTSIKPTKSIPKVHVSEVLVVGGKGGSGEDSQGSDVEFEYIQEHGDEDEDDEDEDDVDDVGSEFGELSIVEPLPLEEGDLGLM